MSDSMLPVPDAVLDDLRTRLQNTRWPSVVEGQGWARGTDLDYLSQLVHYWRTGFDWRAQEAALGRFTHERVRVSDLSLHQIHQRAADPNALPIVLLHGWPDSFLRYTKALPLLDTFHRVVPSLPGFGFSERPTSPGWSAIRMADAIAELMTANGYDRFFVSGGDVGSTVGEQLARRHAERFFTIVQWTELPAGGHFTAWEEPEAFARELTALARECSWC
jgi:epoxide hydrolase